MDKNEQLVVKTKLNFFQKIKKKNLIKNISKLKYEKAPDFLRDDVDVIRALIFRNPQNISMFDITKRVEIVANDMDVFSVLPFEKKIEIINEEPSFILKLEPAQRITYILSNNKYECIKFLSEEEQIKLLTEEIEYDGGLTYQGRTSLSKSTPFRFYSQLEKFSLPVVEQAVKLMAESNNKKEILPKLEISKLPIETQIKIALYDDLLIKKLSLEAAEKYAGQNPMLLKKLDSKDLISILKKQPHLFKALDHGLISSLIRDNFELRKFMRDEDIISHAYMMYDKKIIDDPEVIKRSLLDFGDIEGVRNGNITDMVRNPESLIDIGRFDSITLSTKDVEYMRAFSKIKHVIDLLKRSISDVALLKKLDEVPQKINPSQVNEIENIIKIFLNEKVIEKVSPELLSKFLDNPNDIKVVKEIIAITYGEQTKEIFADRPNLELKHIKTLDIFDPIVRETYGIGMVHNLLSYDTFATNIMGELARNPKSFEKFKQFEKLLNKGENHILDFCNNLIAYKKLENLLLNINLENLSDLQKENLMLVVNDLNMSISSNETAVIPLETGKDLENYAQRRNEMYLEYLEKASDTVDIKNAISRRFFGMQYNSEDTYTYKQTALSMSSMIKYYNLETFVSDERTQESEMFSAEELDMLELMNIINKIDDPNVLKQLYKEFEESKDILTPTDINELKKKIPQQYSKEIVNSLLTVESAKERAEKGEEGISYTVDDGIEIINLHGADFRLLIHTMGMNNSGGCPTGKYDAELWKVFEEGCSTISGCLIEPEMLHSCNNRDLVNIGFATVSSKQIIGMSHRDAQVSHGKGRLDPEFRYGAMKFNYSDELIRKTAAQITGQEQKDQTHSYNEVAMYRKNIDSSQIKSGDFGGRIMPDYIVVYGKANGDHKKFAKSFSKDGKPIPIIEIDERSYGDRTYQRGRSKEDHTKKREEGKVVKRARELAYEDR